MTIGQKFLRFLHNRVFRGVFLAFCVILAIGVIRSVVTIWQKQGIVAERQRVLQVEEAKNAKLVQELQEATSSAFIEKIAREKLGLVKPGETVVIMNQVPNAGSGESGLPSPLPSWKQWWGLFF
jgi:cell division protein FtsB